MGQSKMPLYAYVDETGNTGKNIFDEAQPDFYTAALVTRGDFDLRFGDAVRGIAASIGVQALHANELGAGRLEAIAPALLSLLGRANAQFFISRVEKKYLLATKATDVLLDSGENAAVAWHAYNIKPMKILLAFKMSAILNDSTSRKFWQCLMEPKEAKARAALVEVCAELLERLDRLPDARSREVIGEGLRWIVKHPEVVESIPAVRPIGLTHSPNFVAFTNLLAGLQDFSDRLKRPFGLVTHDEQSEMQTTLATWHELISNAKPGEINWAGEAYTVQKLAGSKFAISTDDLSPGIQIADIALWLFAQNIKGRRLPPACLDLLDYVVTAGWHSDFSFAGVEREFLKKYGDDFSSPIDEATKETAKEHIAALEKRRLSAMADYERSRVPPYMSGQGS